MDDTSSIRAIKLTADGLRIAPGQVDTVIISDILISSSWYFKRGNKHYIVYGSWGRLKVASSEKGVVGPYKINSEPLIDYKVVAEEPCVFADLQSDNFHLMFGTDGDSREVFLVTLNWTHGQEWPIAEKYSSSNNSYKVSQTATKLLPGAPKIKLDNPSPKEIAKGVFIQTVNPDDVFSKFENLTLATKGQSNVILIYNNNSGVVNLNFYNN